MAKKVKTIILEEHHEAFVTWMRARDIGWIEDQPHKLLHIDDHSDWDFPRLAESLPKSDASIEELRRFTYAQLNIGNFIWPGVYRGLIDGMYWHKASFTKDQPRVRMFIVAVEEQEREFITGSLPNEEQKTVSVGVTPPRFVHHQRIPDRAEIPGEGPVILSLCLDYFSGYAYPVPQSPKIEVTAEAFEEFVGNRYHFLKLAPGTMITPREEDGRYWLLFNDYGYPEWPRQISDDDEIARRLERVRQLVNRHVDRLQLITISRSVISGYTPPNQADKIQQGTLDMLSSLLPLECLDFDELH